MGNAVKHLFADRHSSLIDSSLTLRITGWFYQNIAFILAPRVLYPYSQSPNVQKTTKNYSYRKASTGSSLDAFLAG
jgi:hypothetical protein